MKKKKCVKKMSPNITPHRVLSVIDRPTCKYNVINTSERINLYRCDFAVAPARDGWRGPRPPPQKKRLEPMFVSVCISINIFNKIFFQ